MLDDLKYIAEHDSNDALGVAEKQPKQLLQNFDISLPKEKTFQNVVVAGMGGSMHAAEMVKSWPGLSVPFELVRDYTIPKYVDKQTLFIASSFSGNTEETLAALTMAKDTGATIVIIAAGGTLLEQAQSEGYTYAALDKTLPQPRLGVFNNLKALVSILETANLIPVGSKQRLEDMAPILGKTVKSWRADNTTSQNHAKQIANELMGKSIVVYASTLFSPIALRWRIGFQENAKNVAWNSTYPEFNHNEFIGWSSHPIEKPYGLINITSKLDHPRTQKRFEISTKLLSGKRPTPLTVETQGDNLLEQLLSTALLGDFASIYLAILNNVNPTPVELVEKLKSTLAEE